MICRYIGLQRASPHDKKNRFRYFKLPEIICLAVMLYVCSWLWTEVLGNHQKRLFWYGKQTLFWVEPLYIYRNFDNIPDDIEPILIFSDLYGFPHLE